MSNPGSPRFSSENASPVLLPSELSILYEVSRALQNTLDEEEALYTILVGVTAGLGLGFNRAFILLVDPEENWLQGRLAIGPVSLNEAVSIWSELREKFQTLGELFNSLSQSGFKKDLQVNERVSKFRISLQDSGNMLVQIMRSHESCVAVKGMLHPQGVKVDPDVLELLATPDFAAAPLHLADRDLGIILADNAITRETIDEGKLKLLQIYAQAASASIQNTRLYRQVTEKINLCERTNVALRESQKELLQAERLSAVGKMAALVAHEIRNPLVAIGGFARRLLRSSEPDDSRKAELEIIVSEVARLERLVDEVLGYSKITKPTYKPTDVNALIRNVLVILQAEIQKKSIHPVLRLDPDLPSAELDELQLRHAIMNLILNAVAALDTGGTLSITTSWDREFIEIAIADTGVGIPEEDWNKVFTPFFTTKSSGLGLGLVIVSQIIDNHYGSLRFDSVPDQGTAFHIRLPIHPARYAGNFHPGNAESMEATP
jgi:hypothetical protein